MLHQLQQYVLGVNLRLLYVVGIPAILGLLLTRGMGRSFRGRPAFYWVAFTGCMMLAVPFSMWRGNSFSIFAEYIRTNLIMLFVIAGLTVTWRECKLMLYAIGWAAVANLFTARLFQGAGYGSRLSLGVGTIADPNDFAAHLLLTLPFLLLLALNSRSALVRGVIGLGLVAGLFLVLRTASRGAIVGLVVALAVFFFRGSGRQRIALLLLAPVCAVALAVAVPGSAWQRLREFSVITGADSEAAQSMESRRYLLQKSLEYTLQHPLVGVGPGEFAEYEGRNNRLPGMTHGYWHQTHNTVTQISSECGIPAALFFLAGVVSTFRLLSSTRRAARSHGGCRDIENAMFCALVGYAGFFAAAMFLNFGYFFYFPAMGGLAIAAAAAANKEFASRKKTGRVVTFLAHASPKLQRVAG